MIAVKVRRPSKVVEHQARPDHKRSWGTKMAASPVATNPYEVKTCEGCGAQFERHDATPYDFALRRLCAPKCGVGTVDRDDPTRLDIRFANKVDSRPGLGPNGDCWEWIGRKDSRGYGITKVRNRAVKAHRVALFGRDDLGNPLFACHRCDNPVCVRPDHLFAGAAVDNVRDMISKGRCGGGSVPGTASARRKLSVEQVREIRASTEREYVLAQRYGIDGTAIRQARNRLTYRDVA